MSEVSTDILKQNGLEVVNRWYHSAQGVDLFLWYGAHQEIIKIQLSVMGAIVDWSLAGGVRTGMVLEEEQPGSLNKIDASERIQFDSQIVSETLDYGIQVLKAATCLRPQEQAFIFSQFSVAPTVDAGHLGLWGRFLLALRSFLR